MAKLIKLITFAYLKEEVDIPQSIPDEELDGKIYDAQETMRMLISDEFYDSFVAEYVNLKSWTGGNEILYDRFVKKFLARQAYEYWTIKTNFKITNGGFRVHSEDNSTPATDVQMATIIKLAKQKTQEYKNLMMDYIEGNPSLFPLYKNHCNKNLRGNSFHISAIRKKDHCNKRNCRC